MLKMVAGDAAKQFGEQLVGRVILTPTFGDWKQCRAVVTQMAPDPQSPEIVFTVYNERQGSIGVVETEEIGL